MSGVVDVCVVDVIQSTIQTPQIMISGSICCVEIEMKFSNSKSAFSGFWMLDILGWNDDLI